MMDRRHALAIGFALLFMSACGADTKVLAVTGIQIRTFQDGAVKVDNMDTERMKGALQVSESGAVVKGSIDAAGPQGEGKGEMILKGGFSATTTK
jgi:hypothetical protein